MEITRTPKAYKKGSNSAFMLIATHKANVYIDLSGWSPKYFQPQIIQYANTQLRHKMLFGSDFPLIHPEKWLAAAKLAGFREEVLAGIMKDNAVRVLGLG